MKRNYFILLISGIFLFAACDKKKDRIFEESPTDRLNAAVANAQAVLASKPNGWIMQYYAGDDAQYGGNNLFVNFTSATDVNIQADYTLTSATSSYKVYPGAGPILTFDTYNPIFGMFAAPGAVSGYVNNDVGLGGDIEFLVMKATADSVILKSRKRGNRIVMIPLPANPATLINSYRDAFDTYYSPDAYRFETPTGNIALDFQNYMELNSDDATYSFRVTPTGLDFYEVVTVNGITFKELIFMPATPIYPDGYYANAAGTLKLVPIF